MSDDAKLPLCSLVSQDAKLPLCSSVSQDTGPATTRAEEGSSAESPLGLNPTCDSVQAAHPNEVLGVKSH